MRGSLPRYPSLGFPCSPRGWPAPVLWGLLGLRWNLLEKAQQGASLEDEQGTEQGEQQVHQVEPKIDPDRLAKPIGSSPVLQRRGWCKKYLWTQGLPPPAELSSSMVECRRSLLELFHSAGTARSFAALQGPGIGLRNLCRLISLVFSTIVPRSLHHLRYCDCESPAPNPHRRLLLRLSARPPRGRKHLVNPAYLQSAIASQAR